MRRKPEEPRKPGPKKKPAERLPGTDLALLRTALDKRQNELADLVGVAPSTISTAESEGVRRELFERVTAKINLPLDETLRRAGEFREFVTGGAVRPGNEPDPDAQRDRRQLVDRVGRKLQNLMADIDGDILVYEEQRWANILLLRLRLRAPELRKGIVRHKPEYHFWRLSVLLCEESLKATSNDADEAISWAELAVLVAQLSPGEEGWRARVEGYATVHLANALRVKGQDLKAADRAYEAGRKLWDQYQGGSPEIDTLNEARVLSFGVSLRRAQRRFKEALELLEQALLLGREEQLAHLLLQKANLLRVMGDLEAAVAALQKAEPSLHEVRDRRLSLAVQLNLVDYLSVLGLHAEAEQKLPDVWQLTDGIGELDRLRLVWIQGRVAVGTGLEEEGLAALEQVRSAFSARRMAYNSALVSLEMAVLCLKRGQTERVKLLAREMAPIFESQDVHREALAALTLFCQAAEQEHTTLDFVEKLVRFLHRARHNPSLRFAPE